MPSWSAALWRAVNRSGVKVWGDSLSKQVMHVLNWFAVSAVQTALSVDKLLGSILASPVRIAHDDWHAVGTFASGASAGSVALSSMARADARERGQKFD